MCVSLALLNDHLLDLKNRRNLKTLYILGMNIGVYAHIRWRLQVSFLVFISLRLKRWRWLAAEKKKPKLEFLHAAA